MRKLAKDVLKDIPLLIDPTSIGKNLVKEEEVLIDREKEREDIVQILLWEVPVTHRIVSVVPVFGMAGSGITHVVNLVYNDQRVDNVFTRVWADVSGVRSDREIVLQVLQSVYNDQEHNIRGYSTHELVSMLEGVLSKRKMLGCIR